MKRLCFGTLIQLMYQARSNGVTQKSICDKIFKAYGCDIVKHYNDSLSAHLKSGHDNIPIEVIEAARSISFNEATIAFEKSIVELIAENNQKQFVRAIKAVLREDCTISDDTIIGYTIGYEKKNILTYDKFVMAPLLASLFKYAIVSVSNKECQDSLKSFEKNFLTTVDPSEAIFIDKLSLDEDETNKSDDSQLKRTLIDESFHSVFQKVDTVTVAGIIHPSTASIYCVDINNCRLRFNRVKSYLADNIGTYVFSRTKVDSFKKRPVGAIGTQAIIQFQKAYNISSKTLLGELMLYVFLEQELNAPKIMTKIEYGNHVGITSRSDGIHLLSLDEFGSPFNQIVFGVSDIDGDPRIAVDIAFERIEQIEKNSDSEINMVESTAQSLIFNSATTEYLKDIMIPRKHYKSKPDMAFGLFLGYTLLLDPPETDSSLFRKAVPTKVKKDVSIIKDYIVQKIKELHFEGYTFHCYILPFNDAQNEKTSLIEEMLEGK